jgi:hypothetical protein
MAHKIMRSLTINEISGVDFPAQKGAKVAIIKRGDVPYLAKRAGEADLPAEVADYIKRSFSEDDRKRLAGTGAAMSDGSFPIENGGDLKNAIRAIGRAKNPAKAKAHIKSRARALGLTAALPDSWKTEKRDGAALAARLEKVDAAKRRFFAKDNSVADFNTVQANQEMSEYANDMLDELQEAVCSLRVVYNEIMGDDTIADKQTALQESFGQFKQHIQGIVPEGVENAMTAQALSEAGFELTPQGGIEKKDAGHMGTMDPALLKILAKGYGLPETATEAQVLKAAEDEPGKKKKLEDEMKADKALAKMSDKHKAFMGHPDAKMPSGGKEAFQNMEPAERDAHMKANPIDDEEDETEKMLAKGTAFRASTGAILTKKDFGSQAGFDFAKSQAAEIAKQATDLAKAQDDAALAAVTKRVEPLKHIGKADTVAGLLHRITKRDAKDGAEIEALLKVLDGVIEKSGLLGESGSGLRGVTYGKAGENIQAQAEALLKTEPTLKTIEKARDAVRTRNPALAKEESEEAARQRRAA